MFDERVARGHRTLRSNSTPGTLENATTRIKLRIKLRITRITLLKSGRITRSNTVFPCSPWLENPGETEGIVPFGGVPQIRPEEYAGGQPGDPGAVAAVSQGEQVPRKVPVRPHHRQAVGGPVMQVLPGPF